MIERPPILDALDDNSPQDQWKADAAHYEKEIERLETRLKEYEQMRDACMESIGDMMASARTETAREIAAYVRQGSWISTDILARDIEAKYGVEG